MTLPRAFVAYVASRTLGIEGGLVGALGRLDAVHGVTGTACEGLLMSIYAPSQVRFYAALPSSVYFP